MPTPRKILRFAAVSLVAAAFAGSAAAQDKPDNWLGRLFQPAATGSVPNGGSPDWSGQPGASGDPSMTADAIRAAAADFTNCVAGLWPDASRRGISRANFDRFT